MRFLSFPVAEKKELVVASAVQITSVGAGPNRMQKKSQDAPPDVPSHLGGCYHLVS